MRTTRNYGLLVTGLTILAVAQLAAFHRPVGEPDRTLIALPTDEPLVVEVAAERGGVITLASAAKRQQCTMAVIYSRTCTASLAAAKTWTTTYERNRDTFVPHGWQMLWVSSDATPNAAEVLPVAFPFLTYQTLRANELTELGRLRAWPVFFTMDGSGKVVSQGVGAPVPSQLQFNPDCSVGYVN